MSNSKLICYTKLSPNCNKPRNHKIDTITIHHMAGNLTVEQCGSVFAPASRQASSNYGIGSDGRIAMYVEEANRSWCSSSASNDNRAITIEVANDKPNDKDKWHVSDKAINALIALCVDICKRNGIKKLNYTGDKSGNVTLHKWFAATSCPGPYLESKIPYIVEQVNKQLTGNAETKSSSTGTHKSCYRVRKSWSDAKSQIGAYSNLNNAKKACKAGYSVFDENGKAVYTAKGSTSSFSAYKVKITADALNIRNGAGVNNKIVGCINDKGTYTITAEKTVSGQIWGKLKSGAGWICLTGYTKKV